MLDCVFETTPTFELNVLVADASATITINLTDVDENALGLAEEVKSKMSIYPNPVVVVGVVTLEFPDELLKGEWTLMSLAGKELLHGKVDETKQEIDLSDFNNGLYFIQVNHDDISFSIKLIKQ